MRFYYHPKVKNECNSSKLIEQAVAGLSAEQKQAFAKTLDLQEPVATLSRFKDKPSSSNVRGEVDTMTMLALIIRMGDRDLIKGAIESDSFVEKKAWYQSRDFGGASEELPMVALQEAMRMADLDTLEKASKRLAPFGVDLARGLNWARDANDFGAALWGFSSQADTHAYGQVLKVCSWLLAHENKRCRGLYANMSHKSKSAADKQEKLLERLENEDKDKLLELGAQLGSSHIAKAALELGAEPSFSLAALAFENGNPAVARDLIAATRKRAAQGSIGKASRPDKDSSADLGESGMLEQMGQSLRRLGQSLERSATSADDSWEWEAFHLKKKEIGVCLLDALSEPRRADTPEGAQQRALLAQAMLLSSHYDQPAQWTRAMRKAYPKPAPEELIGLARSGRWALFNGRLKDALSAQNAKLDGEQDGLRWLEDLGTACAKAFKEEWGPANKKGPVREAQENVPIKEQGVFRLAVELSRAEFVWGPGARPIDVLCASLGSSDERSGLMAAFEKEALAKTVRTARAGADAPRRI